MIHGLTTAAVLVVMSLHAAFGCCWHHDHGGVSAAGDIEAAHACGHSHAHDDGPHDAAGGETPGGDHDCAADRCRFLAAPAVEAPTDRTLATAAAAVDAPMASLVLAGSSDAEAADRNLSAREPAPPLRALARLCVWRL